MSSSPTDLSKMKIVFFDGYCNLCNSLIEVLIRRDEKHVLKFASLQGETARTILNLQGVQDFDTVVYFRENQKFEKSSAVLKIFSDLGGVWKVAEVFQMVPVSWRDTVYTWVAKNRFRFFGRRDTCRLPTPEEQQQFLP